MALAIDQRRVLESLNALGGGAPDTSVHEEMHEAFMSLSRPVTDADLKLWAAENGWRDDFLKSAINAQFTARHIRRLSES